MKPHSSCDTFPSLASDTFSNRQVLGNHILHPMGGGGRRLSVCSPVYPTVNADPLLVCLYSLYADRANLFVCVIYTQLCSCSLSINTFSKSEVSWEHCYSKQKPTGQPCDWLIPDFYLGASLWGPTRVWLPSFMGTEWANRVPVMGKRQWPLVDRNLTDDWGLALMEVLLSSTGLHFLKRHWFLLPFGLLIFFILFCVFFFFFFFESGLPM